MTLQQIPDTAGLGALLPAELLAQCDTATALRLQGRYQQALDALRPVLRSAPRHAGAWLEAGGLLMLLGRSQQARRCYARLLRLQPGHGLALYNIAQAYEDQGQLELALEALQAAHSLNPHAAELLLHLEFVRLSLCDWHDYDARMEHLAAALQRHAADPLARPLAPLRLLSLPITLALQRQVTEQWSDAISREVSAQICLSNAPATPPGLPNPLHPPVPIRVAYLSADFRNHAMGQLLHGLFALHRRPQFVVFAYSLTPADARDDYTAAVAAGVDHFCCVANSSALHIAARMRSDGIDVLIDLMGHTRLSQPAVLAMRAAPVQLHYLGYPGTLGTDFIDGVVADAQLIPLHLASGYRERVYHLPCAFVASTPLVQQIQPTAAGTDPTPLTRAALGLPASGVVYASFHRAHKLDPHMFALWLDVLRQVPGSVLWLVQSSPLVAQRLRALAARAGLDASRLVFTPPVASHHFAQLCTLADLLLDTAHYGAGATGVVALRAGLPLLTLPGESFASRMGASLCAATGLQDLICNSPSAYVAKAAALGRNPQALADLRAQLLAGGTQLPLFNTAAWVKSFEALLLTLVKR